ncbi:MAG: hypothetical protein AAFS10_13395, partial [Myxococcota bacterium]
MVFTSVRRTLSWLNRVGGFVLHLLLSAALVLLVALFAIDSIPKPLNPDPVDRTQVLRHLNGLKQAMHHENATQAMQDLFPEGGAFMATFYGLSWANTAPHLSEAKRAEALHEVAWALELQTKDVVTYPFSDTQVHRGVFWLGQRNLLLGRYLSLMPPDQRPTVLVDEFHTHSQALNRAFLNSPTHHLDSYPQMAWPADNVTALASLLVHDQLYNTHYRDEAYATWKAWTLNHSDPDT